MATPCKLVIYVGDDATMFQGLASALQSAGCKTEWSPEQGRRVEELVADWYRVLVLDVSPTSRDGLELLRTIKSCHANVPVIILAEVGDIRLTTLGVARLDGAEAVVFKPLTDFASFKAIVHDAFRRLDRWRQIYMDLSRRTDGAHAAGPPRGASDLADCLQSLSPRERQVMTLLVDGKHTKAISAELQLSRKTVEHHRANVLRKMRVGSVVGLVRLVLTS